MLSQTGTALPPSPVTCIWFPEPRVEGENGMQYCLLICVCIHVYICTHDKLTKKANKGAEKMGHGVGAFAANLDNLSLVEVLPPSFF